MTAFHELLRSAQRGRDAGIAAEVAFNRHVKKKPELAAVCLAAHNAFLVAKATFDAAFDAAMAALECAEPDPQAAAGACNAVKAAKAAYDALAAVDGAIADLEAAKAKCDAADANLIGDDPILREVLRKAAGLPIETSQPAAARSRFISDTSPVTSPSTSSLIWRPRGAT